MDAFLPRHQIRYGGDEPEKLSSFILGALGHHYQITWPIFVLPGGRHFGVEGRRVSYRPHFGQRGHRPFLPKLHVGPPPVGHQAP